MNDNKKCEYKGLRTDLRNIIACPKCKSHLAIDEVTVGTNRAIMKGRLICVKCGQFYPVIKGIPRLLPGRLSLMKKETSESFGYQWQAFSNKINQWENRCREYFSPFIPSEIGTGKVLDAGCGYGRWLYEVSDGGGICVGMDLSDAVFAAADYFAEKENCHLVHGDILTPPFKQDVFNTVYSIGVLHHLPNGADEGIQSLIPLVKDQGLFFVWLYGEARGDNKNSLFSFLRKIAKRIPKPVMNIICTLLAGCVAVIFVFPKRFFALFEATKKVSDQIPFHTYRNLPFNELRTDLFDRYATPIEYGYNRKEIQNMLTNAGLKDINISALETPRNSKASWRGWGWK